MGVGAAAAEAVPHFTPSNAIVKQTGNITLTNPAYGTVSCPNWTMRVNPGGGVPYPLNGNPFDESCTRLSNGQAGIFKVLWSQEPSVGSGIYGPTWVVLHPMFFQTYYGTWGPWAANQYTPVPFVNGSATVPSRLVFNNVDIGSNWRMTGTLDVTTETGGLITITA